MASWGPRRGACSFASLSLSPLFSFPFRSKSAGSSADSGWFTASLAPSSTVSSTCWVGLEDLLDRTLACLVVQQGRWVHSLVEAYPETNHTREGEEQRGKRPDEGGRVIDDQSRERETRKPRNGPEESRYVERVFEGDEGAG